LSGYYGGIIMQKTMTKTLGIFTLALLVMSMVGAAECACPSCSACKPVATNEIFNLSPCHSCGNVLSHDHGCGLKLVSIGKTANGGKVSFKKNGSFCYKPTSCSSTTIHDSFSYTIENKCGQYSTGKVTINYKCKC
jgi:hypothetical protein